MTDPAALAAGLTADLIRCASVTPADAGAVDVAAQALSAAGFAVSRCDRGGIANLYARLGETGPVLGFNGHTDVVPPGDLAAWTHPPFSAARVGGEIWGRGAIDMKSGVAAWISAACAWAARRPAQGSLALLITGDEEGASVDGTPAILDWMAANGERLDGCVVGEPTGVDRLGDTVKIGRRGSVTVTLQARGRQGHTAYPQRAADPMAPLLATLHGLVAAPLDQGTDQFDPSTLAVTTVDVGNPASNVIPEAASATLNIRFNDRHTGAALIERVRAAAAAATATAPGVSIDVAGRVSGEAFLTEAGPLVEAVCDAVTAECGAPPARSTGGGTSDARYVRAHCPVVELGLAGRGLMHAVDERVAEQDVAALARLYARVIDVALTRL